MLWTVAIIFVLLWALGLTASCTPAGFIHAQVTLAVAVLLAQISNSRRQAAEEAIR